jgi:F-type H+-transporting ATPase subunit delta
MKNLRVLSAKPLDEQERPKIEAVFTKKFVNQVSFSYEVNGKIIGGIKVVDGDTVYDGTLVGKLEKIRLLLKDN